MTYYQCGLYGGGGGGGVRRFNPQNTNKWYSTPPPHKLQTPQKWHNFPFSPHFYFDPLKNFLFVYPTMLTTAQTGNICAHLFCHSQNQVQNYKYQTNSCIFLTAAQMTFTRCLPVSCQIILQYDDTLLQRFTFNNQRCFINFYV